MIGIVIVAHVNLGEACLKAVEFIKKQEAKNIKAVTINFNEDVEVLHKRIEDAICEVNNDQGVLILVDMFGGTPSNLSYVFLEKDKIEVIAGFNLPILLEALDYRNKKDMNLNKLAITLKELGQKNIIIVNDNVIKTHS